MEGVGEHHEELRDLHLRDLFAEDPERGERLVAEGAGLYLDYSKNRVTDETIALLIQLAEPSQLPARIKAMFRGERINVSEDRSVLHAVAASAQWIANSAISTSFPSLKDAGLGLAYGIYAAFALLSFVFARWVITETKGHELEDMPEEVTARVPKRVQRARREVLADEPERP